MTKIGTVEPEAPAPRRRRRRGPGATIVTALGLVLVLAGLGALGWVAWQVFGTNVTSQHAFTQENSGLKKQWATGKPPGPKADTKQAETAIPGNAIALLRVPAWGKDFEVPILKGTSQDVLARGVGWYDGAAAPGQVGNFAIAGHRITHGQPFSRMLELKKGDTVVVETRSAVYTYVLDNNPSQLTVEDTAGWVLDPVPGHPDEKPTKQLLTMTTCQDLFHSPDRSVAFGHLQSTVTK